MGDKALERITMSIDDELLEKFDAYIEKKGYANRSEGIRDALRHLLSHDDAMGDDESECIGCLSYVYDHSARLLSAKLMEAQHHHHDIPAATLHLHINETDCLETTVLRGRKKEVRHVADHIITQNGVRHGRLHLIPIKDT